MHRVAIVLLSLYVFKRLTFILWVECFAWMHICTLNACLVLSEARRGQWTPWSWSYRWCKILCGCWELNWDPLNLSRINSISINIVPEGFEGVTHIPRTLVSSNGYIYSMTRAAVVVGHSLGQKGKQIFGLFPSTVLISILIPLGWENLLCVTLTLMNLLHLLVLV